MEPEQEKTEEPIIRFGSAGFASAEAAEEDARRTITEDDFLILRNTPCVNDDLVERRRKEIVSFAWVWPPEYGRTLISDSIIEIERRNISVELMKSGVE